MKSSALILPVLATTGYVSAAPAKRATTPSVTPNVTQILQYALTLEHLEDTFYKQGLAQFDESAFEAAGMPSWARGRFVQIGEHETSHVEFLTSVLGDDAVEACTYSFPYDDPKSFASISYMLESVGDAAYIGAAQFLGSDPDALTAAGAILSTEARHSAWIGSAIFQQEPWFGAFDTPLDQNQAYSLAASFITSCPSSNPTLPFKAFQNLTVEGTPAAGERIRLSYNDTSASNETQYFALFSGLNTTFANISDSKVVTLPEGLQGLVFAVVTSNGSAVSDASTIAGPVALSFPFGADASN